MRIPGSWNTLLVISLLFTLILLNYFNLVPLSNTLPFLSFLPQKSVDKISKTDVVPTPTPQPLPPITVKRLDTVKGEGEFVINNPTPQVGSLSLEKQIIVNGTYEVNTKKVTIQASVQSTYRPIHPPPLLLFDEEYGVLLRLEMISDGKLIYQTGISLLNEEQESEIPFRINLPFFNDFVLNIYDESNKLLLSQSVKL